MIAGAFVVVALSGGLSAGRVRDWVDGYGVAGPLVFIALSAALTVCLFPGPLLAAASGLLFGAALGTPVSICAATLGATLAFGLARGIGRGAVEELQGPRLAALRAWVGRRGFRSVLYARIVPGVPYTLVNYAAGLSPVALGSFVAATALGCAPRAFAYTALGGSLGDLGSPEAIVAIALLVAMGLAGLLSAARRPGRGSSCPAPRSAGRP